MLGVPRLTQLHERTVLTDRGLSDRIIALAIATVGGRTLVCVASRRGLHFWDPNDDGARFPPVQAMPAITAMAAGEVGGRTVVAVGLATGQIAAIDLLTFEPTCGLMLGHEGMVHALLITRLDDSDVLVSGGADYTVRVWKDGAPTHLLRLPIDPQYLAAHGGDLVVGSSSGLLAVRIHH